MTFVQFLNEHAELCSPIANMVDPQDLMTQQLKDFANTVTMDCGPQMTNMHTLSNIGTRVVNDDPLLAAFNLRLLFFLKTRPSHLHFLTFPHLVDLILDKLLLQIYVYKIARLIFGLAADLAELEVLDCVC